MYVSYVGFLIHSWFSSDIPYVGFPAAALSQGSAGSAGSAAPYFKGTAKETKEHHMDVLKGAGWSDLLGDGDMINHDKCWVVLNILKHIITSITWKIMPDIG